MGQARGAVQAVARPAPDVAALVLAIPAFAYVAVILPCDGRAAGSTSCSDLASRTGSTGWTDARVSRDTVHASGTAGARIARAFVHVDAAIRSGESRRAFAPEPIVTVHAFAAIQARHWLAVVHVAPAIRPFEALATDAPVAAVNRVHAGRAVRAGITRARRRRCDVATRTLPSVRAVAREAITAILAGAAVSASARLAVTATKRARLALPVALADAREVRHAVHAGTIVTARLCQAFVHIWKNSFTTLYQVQSIRSINFYFIEFFKCPVLLTLITKIPAPALSANALEGIEQVDARAAVQAGIAAAVVDVLVAVHAGVARIADASAAAAPAFTAARSTLAAAARLPVVQRAELRIMRGRLRAISTLPLCRAMAVVIGLRVETRRRITARIWAAMIAIDLALVAGEAHRAHALVSVHQIAAFTAVLARLGRALVDVNVAILAGIAGSAAAMIIVHQIDAERAVLALADAVVDILRAVLPGKAAPASAPAKRNDKKNCEW